MSTGRGHKFITMASKFNPWGRHKKLFSLHTTKCNVSEIGFYIIVPMPDETFFEDKLYEQLMIFCLFKRYDGPVTKYLTQERRNEL